MLSFRPKGEITQETPQTMSSAFIDQRVFFPVDQSDKITVMLIVKANC